MQLRDDRGSLPDGRSHSLHRAAAHVADGEDPLDPGLQRQGHSLGRAHVFARSNEALVVEGDAAAREPARCRIGAGEEEQVGDGVLLLGTGAPVAPTDALQTLVGRAEELGDFGTMSDG